MAIANKVKDELMAWGGVGVVLVIITILLLKFKSNNPGGMTCDTGTAFSVFNVTANTCQNATGVNSIAIEGTARSVDVLILGLSEPANWIIIVIIGVIGFALLKLFQAKGKD